MRLKSKEINEEPFEFIRQKSVALKAAFEFVEGGITGEETQFCSGFMVFGVVELQVGIKLGMLARIDNRCKLNVSGSSES